jgi:uncharacterized membrane protein
MSFFVITGLFIHVKRKNPATIIMIVEQNKHSRIRPSGKKLIISGILIGIGLGGFLDGILLHQILQWHNMLSKVYPPDNMINMKINMMWDGFFHMFTLIITTVGVFLLWKSGRKGLKFPGFDLLTGLLILGWGIFNFVEGLINHHILNIHHVRYINDIPGGIPDTSWGYGFLFIGGTGLIIIGWLMIRKKIKELKNY